MRLFVFKAEFLNYEWLTAMQNAIKKIGGFYTVRNNRNCNFTSTDKPMLGSFKKVFMKHVNLLLVLSIFCFCGSNLAQGKNETLTKAKDNYAPGESKTFAEKLSMDDISILSGSWNEIGYQYGKIIKESLGNPEKKFEGAISFYKQRGNLNEAGVSEITKIAKSDYKKYLPWFIEYLKGLAKGLNCDEKIVMRWGLASWRLFTIGSYVTKNKEEDIPEKWMIQCSCVLVGKEATADKNAILGHDNEGSAWFHNSPGRFVVFKPDQGHSFALYNKFHDAGGMGAVVMNDVGLCAALVGTKALKDKGLGIVPLHVKVANECSTVEEAIEVIKKTPMSLPMKIQLADKEGNIAIVYRGSTLCSVVRAGDDGYLYSTRKAAVKSFKELQSMSSQAKSFLDKRYQFAIEVLRKNKGKIDKEIVADILTARRGDVICGIKADASIWVERKPTFGIVVSTILIPSKLTYYYIDDDPFPGKYYGVDLKPIFK